MKTHLIPFNPEPSGMQCNVIIHKKNFLLSLSYQCSTQLSEHLMFPLFHTTRPHRVDQLWEHTCFEFFFTWSSHPFYWEFHWTPHQNWNCYFLTDYRTALQEESKIHTWTSHYQQAPFQVDLTFNLEPFLPSPTEPLLLGIALVTESIHKEKNYWALSHSNSYPDFHSKKDWIWIQ